MTEHIGSPIELLDGCSTALGLVRPPGRCDSVEFIRSLQTRFQARYQRYLEYLRDGTPIKSPEHFRALQREADGLVVAELKVDKYRLYVVNRGIYWYATHGREKPKNNRVIVEINKALEIYKECA
ncbi:hypothetical protein [Paenarthrobacter sp. PH39-S1]|uniref:hypothetical protein n=1 Tax=Paenarthrobacter sp. PH39-S1 TaxID=3046204 RepID=UPI0024BAD2E3|nr:hypothetical protein [Paenarthrobacter sp. PH39-S1]MDJ0355597.1 hypothetical protein [Paenarthrobacter sp. PH39-S1]